MTDNKNGIKLISEERQRQIEKEGWTKEHDNIHSDESLSLVAALYATPIPLFKIHQMSNTVSWFDAWPVTWNKRYDKRDKHSRIKQLQIAGALMAAEIDRLIANEERCDE